MDASGYKCISTLQVPWSSPHSKSSETVDCPSSFWISWTQCKLPGAGYETHKVHLETLQNHEWWLEGPMAVIFVPCVSQCADTHSIALGFGSDFPICCQCWLNTFCSMAFIGLPWPKNKMGICWVVANCSAILWRSLRFIATTKVPFLADKRDKS